MMCLSTGCLPGQSREGNDISGNQGEREIYILEEQTATMVRPAETRMKHFSMANRAA